LDEFRDAGDDIHPADYPLLLSFLESILDKPSLVNLQKLYANHDHTTISEIIHENGIVRKAEQLLHEYTDKAYRELDKLENIKMKLSLYAVLGKIF
jgi:geranylgeranyl pyrophosphate synthase